MEHAYGTCTGLDELWVWVAETFLLPAGGAFAAKSWTSAVHDQDKGRRPLKSWAAKWISPKPSVEKYLPRK